MLHFIGKAGAIASWNVLIGTDTIRVMHDSPHGPQFTHAVPNYGTSIGQLAGRPGFRLGWARMPDDAEILYFYDRDDDGFGYALNVDWVDGSEWGYAPFAPADEGR